MVLPTRALIDSALAGRSSCNHLIVEPDDLHYFRPAIEDLSRGPAPVFCSCVNLDRLIAQAWAAHLSPKAHETDTKLPLEPPSR